MTFKKYFYDLLLESNPEKRIEFLYNKWYPKLQNLFEKHWDMFKTEAALYFLLLYDGRGKVTDDSMPKDWAGFVKGFITKIVNDIDPDKGKYSDWIIKGLLSIDIDEPSHKHYFTRFWEDSYKIKEDIQKWKKYKKNIIEIDPSYSDINNFQNYAELAFMFKYSKVLAGKIREAEYAEKLKEAEKDAEKVYNSDNYMIVVPKTKEASCAYGRGTRWCTAATGSYNHFNQYNSQGPLYIIINKKTQEKHQFHFQSEQYMDAEDDEIDVELFVQENPELKDILVDLALKNNNEAFALDISPRKVLEKLDEMDEGQLKRTIGNSMLLAVEYGQKNPDKVNNIQNILTFDKTDVWINTGLSWEDLAENFIASSRSGGETEWAISILNGEYLTDYDTYNSYDPSYWDWLDKNSQILIQKYIYSVYNVDIRNMDQARNIVEENDDEYIKTLITHAYDDAYVSSTESKYHELAVDAITDSLGSHYKWNPNGGLSFKWDIQSLIRTLDDIRDHHNRQTNTDVSDFLSDYSEYLRDSGDLTIPNFEHVYGDPNKKDQGDTFNQRIQNDIEIPEQTQQELELSSFRNYFEQIVK